jgi:hypothetical protein
MSPAVVLFGLFSFCTWAHAADEVIRRVSSTYYGTHFESVISTAQLNGVPTWRSTEDNPPLSARAAIEQARVQLSQTLPECKNWYLERVSLEPVGGINQWIYIVELRPVPENGVISGWARPFAVVVLLNGKAVEPIKKAKDKPKSPTRPLG